MIEGGTHFKQYKLLLMGQAIIEVLEVRIVQHPFVQKSFVFPVKQYGQVGDPADDQQLNLGILLVTPQWKL